jgi:hypothetical protein
MFLFVLGRGAVLHKVFETKLRKNKRYERFALALNGVYPDGSDDRRMLEGVQAAVRVAK